MGIERDLNKKTVLFEFIVYKIKNILWIGQVIVHGVRTCIFLA